MNQITLAIVAIMLIIVFGSCSKNSGEVQLRIENNSSFDFDDVQLNPGSDKKEIGPIKAGKKSVYHNFETAYRYGYISLNIQGNTLTLQPIDYVGETPLGPGKYTYVVGVDGNPATNASLTLELVVD